MSENDESKPPKAPKTQASPNLEKPLEIPRPWSHANLIDRFGPEGGEAAYCAIAIAGGYFNPKADTTHRPDLG